jgi:5S rRNA maturation endonuclease (ribonuclease M5)
MNDGDDRFRPLTYDERMTTGGPAYSADQEQLVSPVPQDAPPAPTTHPRLGRPARSFIWTYPNEHGETLHFVLRFDLPERGKIFQPLTLWRDASGALYWRWRGYPHDRKTPLYGLRDLAVRPHAHVIVVEGEKAADAARRIFEEHVVVSAMGGAMAAHRADWEPLRSRTLTIWPDHDIAGARYARAIARILRDLGCDVRTIDAAALDELAFNGRGAGVDRDGWDAADAIAEWSDLAELREAALRLAKPFPANSSEELDPDEQKPRLGIENGHPECTVADLRDILARSRRLYDRGTPVRVVHDQTLGGFVAHELNADSLTLEAHLACQPYKVTDLGIERDATLPPSIARMYLNWRGEWGLPALNGVTTAPLLSEDGSIRTAHGFDPATGLWCERVPDVALLVPDNPTRDQAAAALLVVRDAFRTFCFSDARTVTIDGVTVVDLSQQAGVDESSFLVSLLGTVCRASLWLAPGSLIRAAQHSGSGAGKGKLARCICAVAYGRQPSAVTAGGSKEELEKRISAALLEGGPAVLLDNFNNITLRSNSLDSALTERPSKVRQFRTLELVTVNTVASVFVTGNGVLLAQDTVRRFIPTELDARMEDPERRSFPGDILADVARNRATILAALLTIWRYGRRTEGIKRGVMLGSYEEWCAWVRDPLLSLGCRDPVERLSETKARDPMRQMTSDLFATWWQHHGSSSQTAHRLDLEVQKIIDPHGRGRQHVAAQLEKLAGTRIAGFVLSRQAPVGKWGAATYALGRIVTEEGTPYDLIEEGPTPYAPYDAYDSAVGSRKKATTAAEDPGPRPQNNAKIPIKPETIGIIGGIGSAPTLGPTTTLANATASDEGPAIPPKWTARL